MSLNVAEMVVELGIKGADKTVGAIQGTIKGMSDLGSVSLETKAAIVAAFYAMEQLFAKSGSVATEITNFTALTGISAKTLQQYQYAARQMGISNEEVTSSFVNLQKKMAAMQRGEGAPSGLGLLATVLGVGNAEVYNWMKNPQLLVDKLEQFAKLTKKYGISEAQRNAVIESFGFSDIFTSGIARQGFTEQIRRGAPLYSDAEIASINRSNIAWTNLATKIEMAFGHFNALHGGQIIGDITKITNGILKLAASLDTLAAKMGVFKYLGYAASGWGMAFSDLSNYIDKKNHERDIEQKVYQALNDPHRVHLGPAMGGRQQEIINLYQEFNGPTDPKKAGDAAHKGVSNALLQHSALAKTS
jgi:hypothetical protein